MAFQEQASEIIRASGGRMTTQRQLILDQLAATNDYVDAEQLYHSVSAQDPSISLTTVYRTLNTLEDAQLLIPRYLTRDHERKYYRVEVTEEQYHFTCRRCHRVIPFQSKMVNALKKDIAAQLGVEIDNICMCVDGICDECRKKDEES